MWSIWRPSRRARPCLPGARPTMPAGARPAGGPNPKRPAARRRRSADGASRAAPGRPPQDRARPAHAHGLASTATLCGGIGTVGALWILLALLGFLPTVGGTNPVRFESDSILGMRILSHWFPTTGHPCVSAGHVHECDRPGSAARGGTHDFPLQNHDRDTRPRPYQHRERRQGGRFEADPKTC